MTATDKIEFDENAAKALEERFDPEVRFRPLRPTAGWIAAVLLFALSLFHYYTAGFGLLREVTHRGVHMAFVLALIFLVFAATPSGQKRLQESSPLRPGGIPLHPGAERFYREAGLLKEDGTAVEAEPAAGEQPSPQ